MNESTFWQSFRKNISHTNYSIITCLKVTFALQGDDTWVSLKSSRKNANKEISCNRSLEPMTGHLTFYDMEGLYRALGDTAAVMEAVLFLSTYRVASFSQGKAADLCADRSPASRESRQKWHPMYAVQHKVSCSCEKTISKISKISP